MNSRRAERGFAGIDVLVILVVLLVMSAIGAWSLLGAYQRTNEVSAMVTLRLLAKAQEDFREQHGVYGSLIELTGGVSGKAPRIALPKELRPTDGKQPLFRGYMVRVFLPGDDLSSGAGEMPQRPPEASRRWCAYAWPLTFAYTGRQTFFINEEGALHAIERRDLTGPNPKLLVSGLAYNDNKAFSAIDAAGWKPISGER